MSARSIIESEWDDEWQEEEPELETTSLPAGTALYHGTSAKERFERDSGMDFPAWFSRSISVARHFSKWRDGRSRILKYRLLSPIDNLALINTRQDFMALVGEEYTEAANLPNLRYAGWVAPHNYPDGDDILLTSQPDWEFLGVTK